MFQKTARFALVVCCLAFVALGAFSAAVGPLLPELARQSGVSLASVGAVFSALFFGGLISQLVAGPASDRFGQRPVLLTGLALMALGGAGIITSRSLNLMLPLAVLTGIGQGAVDIGNNLLIAATFTRRKVSALNVLHVFFGLGSVFGPAMVSISLGLAGAGMPALVGFTVLTALLLPLTYRLPATRPVAEPALGDRTLSVYRSPLLWAFSGLLALYVGIEMAMGGWTTTYVQTTLHMPIQTAALVASAYWLALTGGRVISAGVGTRLGPYRILALDLAGAIAGTSGLVVGAGNKPLTIGATLVIGLSFGSIYPTIVALVITIFRASPGKATSVLTAAGSLGGMSLPWLMGVLLTGRGPGSSPWFALTCCLAMAALYVAVMILRGNQDRTNRSPQVEPHVLAVEARPSLQGDDQ